MTNDIFIQTYGRSWTFPPAFNLTDGVKMAEGVESVRQSLQILFLTEPGERIMRESYGAGLNDFMFANITDALLARIRNRIIDAVLRNETRANVTNIAITPDTNDFSRLIIQLTWQLKGNSEEQTLNALLPLNEATSLRLI